VRYWKGARGIEAADDMPAAAQRPAAPAEPAKQAPLWEDLQSALENPPADGEDELLNDAIQVVRELRKASISLLQRRLRIGYTRAARLIDILEEKSIIGPAQSGAQPREVLDYGEETTPTGTPASPSGHATRTWDMRQDG
jgi:S-DNA-T family DNA segregation ATPase FtsK/SpoIIIE